MVVDELAVLAQPDRAAQQGTRCVGFLSRFATAGMPFLAGNAFAATRCEDEGNVVSGFDIRDAGPALDDDAGGFVTKHHGHLAWPVGIDSR